MASDIACCPGCKCTDVRLIKCIKHWEKPYEFGFYYVCYHCDLVTPTRDEASQAALDVDWLPSHEVRFR